MEYSLFSRDAEEQGQIDACQELGMAMMSMPCSDVGC
jgi:aryl-alcohol dehydrogenase-like predicted oxidoreductase